MAKRRDAEQPLELQRTRTSAAWVSVAIAIVFLVLLIIFIAQNDRKVSIHYLGASGRVSEAIALIAAAIAGAVMVFAIGAARIIQLRVAGHRHNKAVKRNRKQAAQAAQTPAQTPVAAGSASGAPMSEAQPVEPEQHA